MTAAAPARSVRAFGACGIRHPHVAVAIDVEAVRPDEQAAAEARHLITVRVELEDGVEVRVEAFVRELIAAGVAAEYCPDVLAVGSDVDVADRADLPAAVQLGPTFHQPIRIRRRLRERGAAEHERGEREGGVEQSARHRQSPSAV